MKKNSGMTIIEILISVCIIAIVLILLFSLLIQVKNEDTENSIQSNYIINQSTFIKELEEDITNYGVTEVSSCKLSDLNLSSTVNSKKSDKYKCIRFKYSAEYLTDNIGFLLIYNYFTTYKVVNGKYVGDKSSWMIEYQRGYYKTTAKNSWKPTKTVMKEIPTEIDLDNNPYVLYTTASDRLNAASVVMPVVSDIGEHYDINLGFVMAGNDYFTCYEGGVSNSAKLQCKCSFSDSDTEKALCNKTIRPYESLQ